MWVLASGLVVGTASLAAAASSTIARPAEVADRALRLSPTFEPDLTPGQRVVAEMVALVNIERGRRGLPFLRLDDQLSAAARVHAADMASMRRMQHVGSDGSDGGIRLSRTGFVWSSWGENIGAGFTDPAVLFESWLNSPDHRANLLGDFTEIGVGVVATSDGVPYWALLVAGSRYLPPGT
jgi:uncharacterized protein YkwD